MFGKQEPTEVLQWRHQQRRSLERRPAGEVAREHWQYAALSANVYARSLAKAPRNEPRSESAKPIGLAHWERLEFLDGKSAVELLNKGLYVEAFRTNEPPARIVVVFEGTTGDKWSIRANLMWLLHFLPGPLENSYTKVGSTIVQLFHSYLREHGYTYDYSSHSLVSPNGAVTELIATGHSLGGGLAQFFAYTFNQATQTNPWTSKEYLGPRVSQVFAFNTSPVTGWYRAPNPPRDHNVTGLVIHRIFEHGEILAYLRLVTSRLVPGGQLNPTIIEYRYNLLRSAKVIRSHSIKEMSERLERLAMNSINQ